MRQLILAVFLIFLISHVQTADGPVYTIHYVKSYLNTQITSNFGCGKSIAYGTYIHQFGLVDAAYKLSNSHIYGFNANCPRPQTYVKIFGDAQDYQLLVNQGPQTLVRIAQHIRRTNQRNVIIQWKYFPHQLNLRNKAYSSLTSIVNGLKDQGMNVFLKAPASYFCFKINNLNYILSQPVDNFIIQMYGQQTGKYITYEDIFGFQQNNQQGYEPNCGKYPSLSNLKQLQPNKKFYIQKTLDSALSGYISQARFEQFVSKAGKQTVSTYFYDDYPLQQIL